ncbi:glycoside hydrolase family 43 protein [Chryseobacterium wangxinyae]|uniref:glycoside hydrolase family 43 protein n=1 Tax=Chryseobacterium sp. CY353 TaxID=2997334 RepID=UPI00226E01BA|nr:glycoside hydrolase family 43 protein [Chryseobacterium sp. CY353]MCY0970430.1 glycoside hydrolase family 43 protein [Chryseobacterium sp. CY353]
MKKILKNILNVSIVLTGILISAQNPIIQTKFTADPAPIVYKDTVFLYTSHDEDDAFGFKMKDWLLYTSTDMVNWTDHGVVASLKDFEWTDPENGAWAPQVIERNGKFYMYCPMPGQRGIGVLVADSPYGPFKDPIGKPLVKNSSDDIDPTVLIDDDGQAYLYWGNPNLWYVKLNKDMISVDGPVVKDPSIAKVKGSADPFHYQEGPWVWKRNGNYYLAYASTCCPEGIGYAMGKSATGPWEFKGMIMDSDKRSNGNHPGIIDFKGKSYVFGFNYNLAKQSISKHYERRSICVSELIYNADGTIQKLPFWNPEGVKRIATLNPYEKVEAETIAYSEGLKTEKMTEWERNNPYDTGKKITERMVVSSINNGDYLKVQGVDFSKGSKLLEVSVASINGGTIEIHTDSLDGQLLGTVQVTGKAEGDVFKTIKSPVKNVKGIYDVYFVFKGNKDLFYFDWWKFSSK